MLLIPINPETKEKVAQAKRAGGIEADYSDLAQIFANRYLKSKGFFYNNNLDQVASGQVQLPLLTYPFLDYLHTLDLSERNLCELGSGNSTIFFSKLYKQVVSYETNENWLDQLRPKLDNNAEIKLISADDLECANFEIEALDCILVDFAGKRTKFLDSYFSKVINKAPIIFLDNSDMYRMGVEILCDNGYTEIPFYGFKSGQSWISCTSMFILNAVNGIQSTTYISNKFTKNSHANGWDSIV